MNAPTPTPQRPTELPPEIAAKLEKRKRFPRARRWFFNFAAALSLLLFVGNYWLWTRGMNGVFDSYISPLVMGRQSLVLCGGGSVEIWMRKPQQAKPSGLSTKSADSTEGGAWRINPVPFEWFHGKFLLSSPSPSIYASIPYWFLQLLFAILPVWWLGRMGLRWSEKKAKKIKDES